MANREPTSSPEEPTRQIAGDEEAREREANARTLSQLLAPPSKPTKIKRFALLNRVGVGGMGVVYAAYDDVLDRKVAVKLISPEAAASEEARQRLYREAQAMAKLSHANVAQVFEAGEHDGQIFIAMEFIEGRTLRAWLRDENRDWRETVAKFVEIGQGLQAAHEQGVVHRDFKPDNVLIRTDGIAKVVDFGLAALQDSDPQGAESDPGGSTSSALVDSGSGSGSGSGSSSLDRPSLTTTGEVMGTPAYMSPEQHRGKAADAASDQFAFCVALYEALYEMRPFAGKDLDELAQAKHAGDLRDPRSSKGTPARVHAAVIRGLSTDPGRRWSSMRALVDALANDPAGARRRAITVAAGAVLLAGVAYGSMPAEQNALARCEGMRASIGDAWDDSRRARVREALLATGTSYAETTWSRVEQGLDAYAEQWGDGRVDACAATRVRGEQSEDLLDRRMLCLDSHRDALAALVDVLTSADASIVRRAVPAVQSLPRIASCADRKALLAETPPPADAEVAARIAALSLELTRSEALANAGKYDEAHEVAKPVAEEAERLDYPPFLARALLQRGDVEQLTGDYATAESSLVRAYGIAVEHSLKTRAAEAASLLVLLIGNSQARHDEGRTWGVHSLALAKAVGTPERMAIALNNLGTVEGSASADAAARDYFERALTLFVQANGTDDLYVAMALNNLGNAVGKDGIHYHERALAIRERLYGPDHPDVAMSLNNVGAALHTLAKAASARGDGDQAAQRWARARTVLERSLAIRERALGAQHPEVAETVANLGTMTREQGDHDAALGYHTRALVVFERALGPDHLAVAGSEGLLGLLAYARGDFEEAANRQSRALVVFEKAFGADNPDVGFSLIRLGRALIDAQRVDEAVPVLERAVELRTRDPDPPAILADARFELARALWNAPGKTRDRQRAHTLSQQARDGYAAVPEAAPKLAKLDAWVAARAAR